MNKTDYEFFHDIVVVIENEMNNKQLHLNIGKQLRCGKECENCSSCNKQTQKDEYIILAYLNSVQKAPTAIPRNVHYSKELQDKMASLPDDVKQTISYFKDRISAGMSIKHHLSTKIYDGSFNDTLLNSRNVYHIHLNTQEASNENEMHNNRADYLLLCIFHEQDAYFVDVIHHPPRGQSYQLVSHENLDIICENGWMNLIGYEEVKNAYAAFPNITDDSTLFKLSSHGNLGYTAPDGRLFYPIFSGVVATGHSKRNVQKMIDFCKQIRMLRNQSETCDYYAPTDSDDNLGHIKVLNGDIEYCYCIKKDLTIERNDR